jgi:hypothetical protein
MSVLMGWGSAWCFGTDPHRVSMGLLVGVALLRVIELDLQQHERERQTEGRQ